MYTVTLNTKLSFKTNEKKGKTEKYPSWGFSKNSLRKLLFGRGTQFIFANMLIIWL